MSHLKQDLVSEDLMRLLLLPGLHEISLKSEEANANLPDSWLL